MIFGRKEYFLLKDGKELLSFQSFNALDYRAEAKTTTQPIEQGSFFSANKVATPRSFNVELGLQGSEIEIQAAIVILERELTEASMLEVITPLYTTPRATLTKVSWSHDHVRGLLYVQLSLEEIKEISAEYTDTEVKPVTKAQAKNPGDVSTTESGQVQVKEPRKSILARLTGE